MLWVDSLDLTKSRRNGASSTPAYLFCGHPLTLQDTIYPRGVGTRAKGPLTMDRTGAARRRDTMVGADDEERHDPAGHGSDMRTVRVDGKAAAQTGDETEISMTRFRFETAASVPNGG
jgi:hypothetical protein